MYRLALRIFRKLRLFWLVHFITFLLVLPLSNYRKWYLAFSYLLAEKFSCSAMFSKKKKMHLLVIRDLLAGKKSCSAELSTKNNLIASGPGRRCGYKNKISLNFKKYTFGHVRPTIFQISVSIRAVWSESFRAHSRSPRMQPLFIWKTKTDQISRMPLRKHAYSNI